MADLVQKQGRCILRHLENVSQQNNETYVGHLYAE